MFMVNVNSCNFRYKGAAMLITRVIYPLCTPEVCQCMFRGRAKSVKRTRRATPKMARFHWAPNAYRQLNGLLCVFKPAELPVAKMLERIQFNLAKGRSGQVLSKGDCPVGHRPTSSQAHFVSGQDSSRAPVHECVCVCVCVCLCVCVCVCV